MFVTHSMALITTYAQQAVLLDHGELIATGEPGLIVDKYHELLFGRDSSSEGSQSITIREEVGGVNYDGFGDGRQALDGGCLSWPNKLQ